MKQRHTDLGLRYIESVPSDHTDRGLPLVILLHGRGSDSDDLAELAPALDDGYRFLFPQAPEHFEIARGYTQGFTWFDGWPPVGDSFARSRTKLLEFIAAAADRYQTPLERTVLGGFSQGALMSLDAGFRVPSPLAGIVAMSGALHEADAPDFATRNETPVLIVHGTDDDVIPVLAARRARQVLAEHRIDADYEEFAMGHWVTPESLQKVRAFIQRCLKTKS